MTLPGTVTTDVTMSMILISAATFSMMETEFVNKPAVFINEISVPVFDRGALDPWKLLALSCCKTTTVADYSRENMSLSTS